MSADDPLFKLTRTDLLGILEGMNIGIPKTTKLKTDRIRHRLERALDGAQRYASIFDHQSTVDPSKYPPWDQGKNLTEALHRRVWGGLFDEQHESDWEGAQRAFGRVCRFITALGEQWKNKENEVVFTDEKRTAIVIRVLSVHAVSEHRPLLVIGHAALTSTSKMSINRVINNFFIAKKKYSVPLIRTLRVEQALFLHLLTQNRKHLSSEFSPIPRLDSRYSCTFLLPTARLNMYDVARLNKTTGCVMCGHITRKFCDGCKSVEYCSRDCQLENWNEHKPLCRTVSTGTWLRLTLDPHPTPAFTGAISATINRYDDIDEDLTIEDSEKRSQVPPNLYDDNYHLVKIQIPLVRDGPIHLLLFDQQRSFQLFLRPDKNRVLFRDAIQAMNRNHTIYRWARRVGDWEWMICFDRAPEQTPRW